MMLFSSSIAASWAAIAPAATAASPPARTRLDPREYSVESSSRRRTTPRQLRATCATWEASDADGSTRRAAAAAAAGASCCRGGLAGI